MSHIKGTQVYLTTYHNAIFVYYNDNDMLLSRVGSVISTGVYTVEQPLINDHLQRAALNYWIKLSAAASSSD
jgi:hypothetical protein